MQPALLGIELALPFLDARGVCAAAQTCRALGAAARQHEPRVSQARARRRLGAELARLRAQHARALAAVGTMIAGCVAAPLAIHTLGAAALLVRTVLGAPASDASLLKSWHALALAASALQLAALIGARLCARSAFEREFARRWAEAAPETAWSARAPALHLLVCAAALREFARNNTAQGSAAQGAAGMPSSVFLPGAAACAAAALVMLDDGPGRAIVRASAAAQTVLAPNAAMAFWAHALECALCDAGAFFEASLASTWAAAVVAGATMVFAGAVAAVAIAAGAEAAALVYLVARAPLAAAVAYNGAAAALSAAAATRRAHVSLLRP